MFFQYVLQTPFLRGHQVLLAALIIQGNIQIIKRAAGTSQRPKDTVLSSISATASISKHAAPAIAIICKLRMASLTIRKQMETSVVRLVL